MKTRRTLVFAVLIAGALAACWWYFLRKSPNEPLVMYGNVEVRQVNLGFKMAGRIEKLNVDEGDAVRPGEVLASLEKVYFYDALAQALAQRDQMAANYAKLRAGNRPEEIAQAKALVAEREATLTNARITLNRAQKLLSTPAGSQKTYDDAAAAERQADAQLNSAPEALRLEEAGFRKEDIDLAKAQLDEREAMVESAKLRSRRRRSDCAKRRHHFKQGTGSGRNRCGRRNGVCAQPYQSGLGENLCLRTRSWPYPPRDGGSSEDRHARRENLYRPDRVYFHCCRVYPEDARDDRTAHVTRLPPSHRRRRRY